jgi:hypothetical protein
VSLADQTRRIERARFPAHPGLTLLVLLSALCLFWARSHAVAQNAECREDITEAMGYKVRSIRVNARWVSPGLITRLNEIVGVGGPYSPTILSLAEAAVADELEGKENRSLEFSTVGAASVLEVDSCVLQASDEQNLRQVDIVIRPHYLRVDLYNVGSNVLPIPRSIEPTFFKSIPYALRAWDPNVGVFSDRAYGVSVKLRTSFKLLDQSGSNKSGSSRLELSATGQKSFDHSFYDAEALLAWSQRQLENRTGWSLAAAYSGFLHPLGDGEYLKNAGAISGQIQLRPERKWMESVLVGGRFEGSSNRLTDNDGVVLSRNSEVAVQVQTLIDGRCGDAFSRLGVWVDNGFRGGGGTYQRVAGFFGYETEFGSGHQTTSLEIILGGGHIWGSVPEYARFFGGNPSGNFLYESIDSTTLASFPVGPTIRSLGQGSAGSRSDLGTIRGGRSFWNVSLNLAIPLPGLSRPLVPDIALGRSSVAKKLKGVVNTARNAITDDLIEQGAPDNDETEAKANKIVDRDIKPTIDFLADHANIYALKPLLLCDVAQIDGPTGSNDGMRVGIGAGLQVTIVTAKLELGYMYAVLRERGDTQGNLFLRLVFQNIF